MFPGERLSHVHSSIQLRFQADYSYSVLITPRCCLENGMRARISGGCWRIRNCCDEPCRVGDEVYQIEQSLGIAFVKTQGAALPA